VTDLSREVTRVEDLVTSLASRRGERPVRVGRKEP
jgi:hypothetical protein